MVPIELILILYLIRTAAILAKIFEQLDLEVAPLHSQLSQPQRQHNLQRFRSQYVQVLIATDVASR